MRAPFPVAAAILALALGAALWVPFGAWWPDGGQRALLFAVGACLVPAILAHVVSLIARRRMTEADGAANAHLIGLMTRMFLTLAAALAIIRLKVVPTRPFAVSISALYGLLLALEVFATLRALGQNHRPEDRPAAREGGSR